MCTNKSTTPVLTAFHPGVFPFGLAGRPASAVLKLRLSHWVNPHLQLVERAAAVEEQEQEGDSGLNIAERHFSGHSTDSVNSVHIDGHQQASSAMYVSLAAGGLGRRGRTPVTRTPGSLRMGAEALKSTKIPSFTSTVMDMYHRGTAHGELKKWGGNREETAGCKLRRQWIPVQDRPGSPRSSSSTPKIVVASLPCLSKFDGLQQITAGARSNHNLEDVHWAPGTLVPALRSPDRHFYSPIPCCPLTFRDSTSTLQVENSISTPWSGLYCGSIGRLTCLIVIVARPALEFEKYNR
ncbi:hypothetical protein F5Y18DRAFT_425975 [Xylariaceae sp. FL1019]|nr:hypothetical protein F5Y18DRAFT_425975 [Xylariaceae sp. FL1019]